MLSQRSLRRLAVCLLISLILALSFQMILDHHVCSDHHCLLCQLIRSATERSMLIAVHWSVLTCVVLLLLANLSGVVYPTQMQSPVQQKVKITC